VNTGTLYMIPCPIVEGHLESIPPETIQVLHRLTHFYVEKAKTARHFIKDSGHPTPLSAIQVHEISDQVHENEAFLALILSGVDIGVISEAGCPGIADPGAEAVSWAHKRQISVVPLPGPSSIFMALMASGFNGQSFAFNGYLSNKKPALVQQLKNLESRVKSSSQTQIFMETPYRNAFMLECVVQALHKDTMLCIACNISSPDQNIRRMKVGEWKSQDFSVYHKKPCIFIIG
jgi:16S rRNA (cytidine1402-2'-O)-methyltransferase